jgi:uncharacterized protein YjbJ (UPF0337 family)
MNLKSERAGAISNAPAQQQPNQPTEGKMNKDTVKGTVDDAAGRAKRQVGEWTGDTQTQVEGAAQQVKGKAEKAWGNVKDAVHDAHDNADANERENNERERERLAEERKHHEKIGS